MLDVVVLLTITSNLSSLIHQRKINNNYFGKSPEMMNGIMVIVLASCTVDRGL
jgi:hypothetical protein